MKNLFVLVLIAGLSINFSFSQGEFIKNEGQIVNYKGEQHGDILFYKKGNNFDIAFTKRGVSYYFSKTDFEIKSNFNSNEEEADYNKAYKKDSTFFYRLDMEFVNPSNSLKVESNKIENFYYNFYYPHCPNGIMNVEAAKKIVYKNVYDKIDFEFYFAKNGELKYDIILNPGANINDVKLYFNGANDIKLIKNELKINSPVGEIIEILPKSFIQKGQNQEEKEVKYSLQKGIVSFNLNYDNNYTLVIDPQIVWSTYYDNRNTVNRYQKVRGNQFLIGQYSASIYTLPTLTPGGSGYFQNSNGGLNDMSILKFDTSGVRQWCTYYGGTDYDYVYDLDIMSNGDIIIAGTSESTNIPKQNPGGGAYYDGTYTQGSGPFYSGTWDYTATFIIRFNSSGVRSWATHYDYLQYPEVEIDNNDNIYIVGFSNYDSPPTQNPGGGAYYQSTITQKASITNPSANNTSGDMFILKFNSSNQRVWATNLGGDSNDGLLDFKLDGNNNLFIFGSGDNYNGTNAGFTKLNPGGGAYYDAMLGTGTGGSSTDRSDLLLYKFSPTGVMQWGTAFGGDLNEYGAHGSIEIDNNNNIIIFGATRSTNLPVINPGGGAHYDATINTSGSYYGYFFARFNTSLQLDWCTYYYDYTFGGNFPTYLEFTSDNRMLLGITAHSSNYPITPRAGSYNQSYLGGSRDIHIAEFSPNLSINWSTYLGCTQNDVISGLDLTANPNYSMFITGHDGYDNIYPLVNPGGGAYFDNVGYNGSEYSFYITKMASVVCDTTTNTTSTASICETGTKTLVGTPLGGTWSVVSGGGSISGTTYTAPSVSSNTLVTLRYKITGAGFCPDDSTDVTFTVNNATSTVNTTTTDSICSLGTKALIATPSGGTWSIVSGGGSITGNTYTAPTVASNTTITIKYRTPGTGGCPADSANVTFTVEPTITPAITSSNGDMCIGEKRLLTGTPTGGVWSITGGTGSGTIGVGDSLLANTSGTIQLRYRITNACGNNDATQTITVSSSISVSIISSTSSLCADQTRVLTGAPTGGVWNILNGPATESGGVLTPNGIGTAQIEYAVTNSCGNGADTVNIVINPLPNASAGIDENICVGDTITLTATGGGTYQWTPGAAGANNQVFPTVTTGYRVDVTSDSGCVASDSVTVFVQSTGTATAQNDQGNSATGVQETINVYSNDVGGINTIQILNGPSHGTATVSNGNVFYTSTAGYIGNDTLVYEICDANCGVICDTAIVVIVVENDLTIPIGISPNGDGKNDVFNILGLSRYPNNNIQIFNRWGSLIYEAQPYLNDWNGQSKKGEVIEGTYFYILKLGDDLPSYNGYIELKK